MPPKISVLIGRVNSGAHYATSKHAVIGMTRHIAHMLNDAVPYMNGVFAQALF